MSGSAADGVLFVVWAFPKPSETFIQRELVELERRGIPVQVLAARRVERTDLDPLLARITDRATFLGSPARIAAHGAAWAARHPARFAAAAAGVARMQHRDAAKRARALSMVVAAAAAVEPARAIGVRYVHAHFAARATELAIPLAAMLGVPYGVTAHAYDIYRDGNALPDKIAGARAILTCTTHNLEHLRSIAPQHAGKIHLVHHGIDLALAPPPTPLPTDGAARFLAVGRLVPKKGFEHLVSAMSRLRADGVEARLTILGDGPEAPRLAAAIRARGLQDVVELGGAVPNRRVWEELAAALALVMPSIRDESGDMDGIPNVVLEAMACARPVIGTQLSGIPEVVLPERTGLLVPPGDEAALAAAMSRLAADRPAAARMGRNGRELVEGQFDVRQDVDRQLAIYATI